MLHICAFTSRQQQQQQRRPANRHATLNVIGQTSLLVRSGFSVGQVDLKLVSENLKVHDSSKYLKFNSYFFNFERSTLIQSTSLFISHERVAVCHLESSIHLKTEFGARAQFVSLFALWGLRTESQSQDMAGSNNSRALLLLFVILLPSLAVQGAKQGPGYLQLFAHESRVPPTNTLIVSAAPSGNKTGADEFGLIRTVSNVLRAGRSNESTIIGSQVGIVVVGKDTETVYISFTYFLNANATHQGTIAIVGHIDGTSTMERVFAVVGGTGDFLSVTGEDRSAFDSANPPNPANVVNVHNLTLQYCPRW